MNILSIDAGTYSIKFLYYILERKTFKLIEAQEIVLHETLDQFSQELTLEERQFEIIKRQIPKDFDGKLIFKVPNNYITTRYLTIPVTNRKKVQMMIPFQLDEHLPYPVSQAHFVSSLTKNDKNTTALITIAKQNEFKEFFLGFETRNILPNVFTTELGVINSYVKSLKTKSTYAILDIGHFTTKCFIIHENQVVSNHTSHTAGSLIDELISESYNIPLDESIIYKHENCFFLTDSQFNEVDEDQQEFAKLMKTAMHPLAMDIKRWLLGFRVKYGEDVEKVFLTGGTSRVSNIENFLAQYLEINIEIWDTTLQVKDRNKKLRPFKENFQVANLMAITQMSKEKPKNMLTGEFSNGGGLEVPLHSTSYITLRTLIISLLISSVFGIEIFFAQKNQKQIEKKVKVLMKNPTLGFGRVDRTSYLKRPEKFLKNLIKKSKSVEQEVKLVQSAAKINALSPLAYLSQTLSSIQQAILLEFRSEDNLVMAVLKTTDSDSLKRLNTILQDSGLSNLSINPVKGQNAVKITYEVEK